MSSPKQFTEQDEIQSAQNSEQIKSTIWHMSSKQFQVNYDPELKQKLKQFPNQEDQQKKSINSLNQISQKSIQSVNSSEKQQHSNIQNRTISILSAFFSQISQNEDQIGSQQKDRRVEQKKETAAARQLDPILSVSYSESQLQSQRQQQNQFQQQYSYNISSSIDSQSLHPSVTSNNLQVSANIQMPMQDTSQNIPNLASDWAIQSEMQNDEPSFIQNIPKSKKKKFMPLIQSQNFAFPLSPNTNTNQVQLNYVNSHEGSGNESNYPFPLNPQMKFIKQLQQKFPNP